MMVRRNVLVLLAVLLLGGCAEANEVVPTATVAFRFLPTPSLAPTMAVVQVTVAPLPAPVAVAAAATATPATYVVQEGDTLIGIAARSGITLEALEAANPGVLPQALQPGQVLVIPLDAAGEGGAFLSAATPMPLVLSPAACFETPVGSRWCFLEARNEGAEPVENPTALVTLAGADGEAVMTDVATSPLNLVPVGGAVPLAVLFPPTRTPIAGAAARLVSAGAVRDPEERYLPLVLTRTGVEGEGGHRTVSGEVWLEGDRPARRVRLVLTLYNDAGQITGYRALTLAGGLLPGQSLPFSLGASALAGSVARFSLLAEAQP